MKTGTSALPRHIVFLTTLAIGVVAASPFSTAWAQAHSGWAVGDTADGYATIVHTTDGGATWQRQGSPDVVPEVVLYGVSAADASTAWAVARTSAS